MTGKDAAFEIIAERGLECPENGNALSISVLIGKPYSDPRGDWSCPIQILGIGDEKIKHVGGVDAVQALQLAMQMAGSDLALIARTTPIKWNDESDLGFPICTADATGRCPYCPKGNPC